MEVSLMVRRKRTTIFIEAKENTSVLELKKMVNGILKVQPEDQQLFNKNKVLMMDDKMLYDYGIDSREAKPHTPAFVGLAIRMDDGEFEELDITRVSIPADMPYFQKPRYDF